jgi:hypothetical protein
MPHGSLKASPLAGQIWAQPPKGRGRRRQVTATMDNFGAMARYLLDELDRQTTGSTLPGNYPRNSVRLTRYLQKWTQKSGGGETEGVERGLSRCWWALVARLRYQASQVK